MNDKKILTMFSDRTLGCSTNNYIFSSVNNFEVVDTIPSRCFVELPEHNIDIDCSYNIKINLNEVCVEDILTYSLEHLKKLHLLDVYLDYRLDFESKSRLFKFQNVLRRYNVISQLIFYNLEGLPEEYQMLLNEIYNFNSVYFNVSSFIKDADFQTYSLFNGDRIEEGKDYTKIKLLNIPR